MNAHDLDQAIEEDLEKLSVNISDVDSDSDTDIEADFTASNETRENDLPDSVFAYFKASSSRVNTFEQVILEDLDDLETMCNEMYSPSQHITKLDSNSDEDPLKLKERILSEIEEQVDATCDTHDSNGDYDAEYETHKQSERQLMFEWRKLEERLKIEEEQRLAELETEREQCLKSAREEEEKRRLRSEQFNEELRRNQVTNQVEYFNPVEGESEIRESLQLEMVKQKELIKRLEDQIEEERRVFKEVQQEERRRFEARCTAAATKLQAAFRGTLVRRWSKQELTKRREEERRMKMEWEMERRRVEQEEQRHREEAERRRAKYERAKEQERHRLERERRLEEQRRKETEEAKRIEDARKSKEEEKEKRREERRVEEKMRNVQAEKEKIKKEEKAKITETSKMNRKEEVESPKTIEERRVEEKWRNIQEDEEKNSKEKAKAVEAEIKRKEPEGLPQRIEERRMEEERRKVQEDEENTRTAEEKTKWIQDERKRKDEDQKSIEFRRVEEEKRKVQMEEKKKRKEVEEARRREEEKEMEERRVEEEKKRKEVEEAKRTEDERKSNDEEKQKEMEERKVEEERKRKEVEEAKRTEDERKINDEEKQKSMEISRVEEEEWKIQEEKEKKRKEEEKEKKIEAQINRKEDVEWQKRKNETGAVEEMKKLKQKGQLENETEPVQKEQNQEREEKVIHGRNDGQNMEEGSRNVINDSVKGSINKRENPDTNKGDNISQLCLSQSVNMSRRSLAKTLSPRNGQDEHHSCHQASTLSTDKSSGTMSPPEEKSVTDTRGPQCALDNSSSACLPDSTEQKRLAWMMNCTSWSKLSIQNKRKGRGAPPRRRGCRRASGNSLLPLPVDTILRSGPWSCLKQVTSVTLEDLPSCSISTLSECTRLQSLTLRRCGLQALNGLNQCAELQHIDLQENNITYIDCGGLARLEVLLLGRNQLTSIHGLDDAVNLTVLQLSHNIISRISGLGSLRKLHCLTLDHNQLISTRGLSEAFTLLQLDCSYNHLSIVEGLESCALLNTLDLRGNSLMELPVLKNHVLLRELYLDDNSICSLHGLESCWLPLLRCLSVSQNSITQLPMLMDLLSLTTLNVSNNCLSELKNICMSLQGCAHLQELNITDNPVQEENNWRSSVLAVIPSLIKLNAEQTGASGTLSADSTQLWSFQALCQAHQDQIDSVLQRHSMEIGSAPSALHAQLLVGNHAGEMFRLAEKQRYAHEYGDSGVCETAMQETVASSCLQELSERELEQEKGAEAKSQHPAVHTTQSWETPHLPNFTQKCQSPSGDHNAGYTESTESPTQKSRNTPPSKDGYSRYALQASRMDLKTVAAVVIQQRWREHRQRRRMCHLRPPAKAPERSSPQGDVKSCKTRPECLNKDHAATVIQAAWRGYLLRKRLTRAVMLAQISEADEAFEEVDMDEFVFDEEAMERDWTTLRSDMSPSSVLPHSQQPPLPKPLPPLPELQTSATVQPWKPRQAWINGEEAPVAEHPSHQSPSPDPRTRMRSPVSTMGKTDLSLSERSEKIMEEWGISSGNTAHLMLKRAHRMKARKQQYQRKLRDPVVRLALFRNHSMRPVVMETQRSRPAFREEIKAGRADMSAQEALRGESEQMQTRHRTYQWLQTQSVLTRASSAASVSDHFLPEIDPEILSGGRVQLVASTGYREAPDVRQWTDGTGFSSPQNHQTHTRTHSAGYSKKEVPSPQKVTLAPSRKERISFRDNPVQLSGGWGGGKKRSNANKLK